MEVPFPAPLSAGSPVITDDYVREKLAEAQADVIRGDVAPWDVADMKRTIHELLSRRA